jgi:hypothetical protein
MGVERLVVTFVLYIPNSKRFVVGRTDDVFSTGMEEQSTNPVIMTYLNGTNKHINEKPITKFLDNAACYHS